MAEAEAAAALGLGAGFTADDVKAAHRRLAREHHPDIGGDADRFRQVQEAFECLRGCGSNGTATGSETTTCGRPLSDLGNREPFAPDCVPCEGRGYTTTFDDWSRILCRRCRGMGIVVVVPCKFCSGSGCSRCKNTGMFWLKKPGTCHACGGIGWRRGGSGKALHHLCRHCDGNGQRRMFNPVIPRGAILRG